MVALPVRLTGLTTVRSPPEGATVPPATVNVPVLPSAVALPKASVPASRVVPPV